jgi:hypothetical protein
MMEQGMAITEMIRIGVKLEVMMEVRLISRNCLDFGRERL